MLLRQLHEHARACAYKPSYREKQGWGGCSNLRVLKNACVLGTTNLADGAELYRGQVHMKARPVAAQQERYKDAEDVFTLWLCEVHASWLM